MDFNVTCLCIAFLVACVSPFAAHPPPTDSSPTSPACPAPSSPDPTIYLYRLFRMCRLIEMPAICTCFTFCEVMAKYLSFVSADERSGNYSD